MPLSELMGGARIRHIFLEMFGRGVAALDPLRELGDEDVRTAIKNSSGVAGEGGGAAHGGVEGFDILCSEFGVRWGGGGEHMDCSGVLRT
jgi:hypothetical protein